MDEIIFESLDTHHIDKGWLSWVKEFTPNSYTEFIRIPPTRDSLEGILKAKTDNEIWLAASLRDDEDNLIYFANIHISHISWIDRRCTFGRLIGNPLMRGKGIGTKLTRSILNYCFKTLNMNKVTAGCLSINHAAIKSNIKAGMIEEAVLKNDHFINGSFVNTHLFAAWQNEWIQRSDDILSKCSD